MIKNLPTNQSWGLDGFTDRFFQTFREVLTHILMFFQKLSQDGTLLRSLYEATIILKPKPDKHNKKRKENHRLISLMNIDTEIHNKILANWIQQGIKKTIHQVQVGSIPDMRGFFNKCKINIYHILTRIKTTSSSQ